MYARISAALVAVALVMTGLASAQERFGTLTGVVTDQQGAAVPGVTIVVTNVQTGEIRTFVTDGDGRYNAADLSPGRYTVAFELTGFSRVERTDINVLLGRTFDLSAQLRVGALTETVQVTAEAAPLVDVRSTTTAHNVTAEEFDRMPKSRTFQSVAMAAPSVNQGTIEGGIQVNGASGSENAFTVDGVVTNSLINGQSRQNAVFEYLQEVQVKTVGIPAEFGGALGGVVSAVTKSGGNTFRGETHFYYEGSALGAAPPRRLVLNPVDDRSVGYFQDSKPTDRRNEIGGSVGGPIIRDRLFFFGSISPRFNHNVTPYNFSNGTEPDEVTRDQTIMSAFGKVTYSLGRLRADFSSLFTPTTSEGTLLTTGLNGFGSDFSAISRSANEVQKQRGYEISQRNLSGNVDVTLSNASFASFKVGHFYDNYTDTGIPNTTSYTYQSSSLGLPIVPPALQGGVGFNNTPMSQITNFDRTKRTFFNADYNQAFSAGGLHTLKAGAGIQRTVNEVDKTYPGGFVYIFWDRAFTSSVPGVGSNRGTYGYYEVNDRGTAGTAGANIISLYVQDSWTMNSRLTVNLGVRTENEKIPSFRPDVQKYGIEFGFADKIAPRLGAAFDVRGDGRMKIFGSWGRYYDWTKYELARGTFGGDFWRIYYRGLDTLDLGSLNVNNKPGRDLWGSATGFRDRRVPAFETIDPDIKPMSQNGLSVGWEHQLASEMVFSATYVRNDLVRTIEDLGALVDGDEVYFYANPGEGIAQETPTSGRTAPFPTPKPKRQYDALELVLNKRFSQRWFGGASYVLSRLYGNYSGIQSSDEIRTQTIGVSSLTAQQQDGSQFRPGGNANRAWDIDELLFDSRGNLDVRGRLATDRPHVVKLYGAYEFPFGTQVGAFFYGGSGTPITTYVNTINQTEVMVNGRGDMGRTPVLTLTNLLLAHDLDIGGVRRLRFELNVNNLFNQKTSRHIYNYVNRGGGAPRPSSSINLASVDLRQGYDYNALIAATPDRANALDGRYGMDDLFNEGTQAQFLVKFSF
jgi:Carboxypeptidase regulatory-like domain/TonB dependent receptor